MSDFLPVDILLNIFSRLPVKSLACCRCVCKSWLESVAHPHLQTIHVKEEPRPLIFQRFQSRGFLNMTHYITSFLRVIPRIGAAVKELPILDFWIKETCLLFLSSCNGLILVCLSHHADHGTTLGVINPLRKECYELPTIEIWSDEFVSFRSPDSAEIGFDDSTNTFKVVSVFQRDPVRRNLCTMVHVLGTSSWRKVAQVPSYPITGQGVFANGSLHWLVSTQKYSPNRQGRKIVRFDVKKEEFEMIINPPEPKEQGQRHEELVDLNGEVGYLYNNSEDLSVEVWILKQEDQWMLQCRIARPIFCNYSIKVLGCWNNEGDILMNLDYGRRLLIYELRSGELREIDVEYDPDANILMHRNNLLSSQRPMSIIPKLKRKRKMF